MKKLTSLILIVLLIGLFMISCTGGETSDLPAHLRDYFSSDALMMMPDDTVITMKIDSLNDVYKALEFGYLNDAMTEEQLQKLVNKFDINPLQTANIEDMYGIDPDKPIIIAVKEINATGPFNPENILFMMAFPFTDENKLLTEVFEIDLEEYTIEEVGGGSIYVKDLGPNTGVMRDGYFIALGSPEASKEDIKSIAETMLTLPEDQTLRNSERYIQHMSNSNPESIFNFYMDIAAVDIDPEEIMELMGNYGNPGPFNAFGSMANFDQIEELEYALMDGYVSDKTMGMSLYTESVEGSDIFSGSYPMSDIFKNIPGEIALFSYQNSDMSNISEEMVQDIT